MTGMNQNKTSSTADIHIYGAISSDNGWGAENDTTPNKMHTALDALGGASDINVYINSPGGDVFASHAIYNMLKRHSAKITVHIDGLAASGASIIAMAGDKILMPSNAIMMIHEAWTMGWGNAKDLQKIVDTLETINSTVTNVYAERTGMQDSEIKKMLAAETWLTSEEAVKLRFADAVVDNEVKAAMDGEVLNINGVVMNLSVFKNAPKINKIEPESAKIELVLDSQPVNTLSTQLLQVQVRRNKYKAI